MAKRTKAKTNLVAVEERAVKYSQALGAEGRIIWMNNSAGVYVDETTAMEVPAVQRCVELVAGTISTLNINTKERFTTDEGTWSEVLPDHPLTKLLDYAPNDEQTSEEFWYEIVSNAQLYGNGYAEIVRVSRQIVALKPIHPARVRVYRDVKGKRVYEVKNPDGVELFSQRDIIHIKSGKDPANSLIGLSVIDSGRQAIGLALAAQRSASGFYERGMTASGFLTTDHDLTRDVKKRAEEEINAKLTGVDNHNKLSLLPGGWQWVSTGADPEKSQLLQTRLHQDKQICNLFGIPPSFVTGDNTYAGGEQDDKALYKSIIRRWLVKIEQELQRKLIELPKLFIEFDFKELMRSDEAKLREVMDKDLIMGRETQNEQRATLDRKPLPGGDILYTPVNVQSGQKASPRFDSAQVNTLMVQANKGEISPEQARALLKATSPDVTEAELNAFFPDKPAPEPAPEAPTASENGPPDADPTPTEAESQPQDQGDESETPAEEASRAAKSADDQGAERSKLVETQRNLLAKELAVMLTKEINARKRAAEDPERQPVNDDWLEKQAALITKRIKPAVASARAVGVTVDDAEEIARSWIDTSKQQLAAYTDGDQDGQALVALLDTWKATRVEDSCKRHVR